MGPLSPLSTVGFIVQAQTDVHTANLNSFQMSINALAAAFTARDKLKGIHHLLESLSSIFTAFEADTTIVNYKRASLIKRF